MDNLVLLHNTQRYQCYQTVFVIAFVIINIPTNIGNTQRVTISSDTCHHAVMNPLGFIVIDFPKAERISTGDHLGTHAHYISHIPTYAGGSTFIRDYLGGMIMRLMAHNDTPTTSINICGYGNHTSVLLGAQNHIGTSGGKLL